MKIYTESEIGEALDFPRLIEALKTGFTEEYTIPKRMHLNYQNPEDRDENTLLLMPAVQIGKMAGVKIVNVAPQNGRRKLASIQGIYYLMDAVSGVPKALFDAKALTNWRTAAASALAAGFLAPNASRTLLMVGTGALAPFVIEAHAAQRPIEHLLVYGRSKEKAQALVDRYKDRFHSSEVINSLSEAVPMVDIISVATFSETPLIKGDWLRPGQHLDLIGSFKPNMREADDMAMQRSRIYVDILDTAPKESGDLAIPLETGIINHSDIQGDLFQLCQHKVKGRVSDDEITLFKSVGHALEDLVAAQLVLNIRHQGTEI